MGLPETKRHPLGTTLRSAAGLDAARARARGFLVACGYGERPDGSFARGCAAFTAFAFSPRAWAVTARVELEARGAEAVGRSVFELDDTGQTPTAWELDFFREEITGLQRAVSTGEDRSPEVRRLARRALGLNLALAPILGGVLLGPTAGLAWLSDRLHWEGTTFALAAVPLVLASLGAAAFFMGSAAGSFDSLPHDG